MKRLDIVTAVLKGLLVGTLLTSCQNDQAVIPNEMAGTQANGQNAKINAELKLINDSGVSLQYVKQGKFFGKISKAYAPNYTIEYTYDNNNPAGDLWINRKTYAKPSNTLVENYSYQVSNGLCIAATDVKNGVQYQYKYNAQNLLEEVKWDDVTETYVYGFSLATKSFRLTNVTRVVTHLGQFESMNKFTISYTSSVDKYPMNPQLIPYNGIDR